MRSSMKGHCRIEKKCSLNKTGKHHKDYVETLKNGTFEFLHDKYVIILFVDCVFLDVLATERITS